MLLDIILWLLIGALVGWIASKISKSKKGLLAYVIIGILGSVIGGYLFDALGIDIKGMLGSIIAALAGALILLFILKKIIK